MSSSSKKDKKKKDYDEKRYRKDDYDHDKKKYCKDDYDHDKKKYCKDDYDHDDDHDESSSFEDDHHKAVVVQDADQFADIDQDSDELIFIKDSCNIEVQTTDNKAAVSLQVGLQLAIAVIIRISILDTINGESFAQELLQAFDSEQTSKQKIIIENSKDIKIITEDTDLAVNIQALLQVLVSLVAKIDIL